MKKLNLKALLAAAALTTLSAGLVGCNDKSESTNKTTTTKVTDTPEGTKVTTEKVEKKVETETKKP